MCLLGTCHNLFNISKTICVVDVGLFFFSANSESSLCSSKITVELNKEPDSDSLALNQVAVHPESNCIHLDQTSPLETNVLFATILFHFESLKKPHNLSKNSDACPSISVFLRKPPFQVFSP